MAIRLAHQSSAQQNAVDRAQWQLDPLTVKQHRQPGCAPVQKMLAQHHLAVMLGHVGLIKLLLDYGDSVRDLQKTGTFQSFLWIGQKSTASSRAGRSTE
jgi:hypothetical protein